MLVHNKLCQFILSFIGAVLLLSWTSHGLAEAAGTKRIQGGNRYETAVKVAEKGWPNGADTVIVVQGRKFADALTGTPLAYKLDAPILLTPTDDLAGATSREINRLNASHVIILGGPNAVSKRVKNQIEGISGVNNVDRIAGDNRFETAQLVAKKLGNYDKAVVAYAKTFPDSLSIAAYAAKKGYPILLTLESRIPSATKAALNGVSNTIVVGGEGVVSRKVYNDLASPNRISGDNRYETAQAIISKFYNGDDEAFVATGEKFADALSGSVLAAKQNEPIVLVKETKVPESTRDLLRSKDYGHFTLLGGTGAVSSKAVRYVLNPSLYPRERLAGEIIDDARSLLGVPYSWGGTSPSGFDCSGFVNYVMDRKNGISLPRTSRGMWSATNDHRVSNLKTGDLVFFNTSGSGISHVGIYIGDGQFISATSDGVSIAPVHGKWYWGDRYVGATRVF